MTRRTRWLLLGAMVSSMAGGASASSADASSVTDEWTVAVYYFPNYHPSDARNQRLKGPGWSEWELVRAARPRFAGHRQPLVPLWGYENEADPAVMARKIDAAADHGVDVFLFDWYWYHDGPFLEKALDEGFLQATNRHRMKFALMWANHDWKDIHPHSRRRQPTTLFPGKVSPETFRRIGDICIERYFRQPNHWRIDGQPYFSFYDLTRLVESFGSVAGTRAALDDWRARAVAAGLPGLHLNAVVWGRTILPGETTPADPARLVRELGFDSVTSYVWIHHVALPKLVTPYEEVWQGYERYWDRARAMFGVPYYPNVTMGWDSSPRTAQDEDFGNFGYPFMNTMSTTPDAFREALRRTRQKLEALGGPRIITVNAWNEWTEGSYLEPDTVHRLAYLEAIREVFGSAASGAR
ncbi:MAG: glycoside hydrolase family 99-like domain-containing protein [Kiritimatiellae bacterium]|nr:glycoside hydrolase family 99-like domain-containing protein [Kiritimatiellia bacterium]